MNRRPLVRAVLVGLLAATSVLVSVSTASACGFTDNNACSDVTGDGAVVGLTRADVAKAGRAPIDPKVFPGGVAYEWTSVYSCPFNGPGGEDVPCAASLVRCLGNPPALGQGPQVAVYRRVIDAAGGPVGGWERLGTSCLPDLVPGKPTLSIASIQAQFHRTVFAKPMVHIQPEGNVTLVTLPTFFEVRWPAAGFQPMEVDTTTLLGFRIRIRPIVEGYTYYFGDDTSFGPTPSPGGIYPNGDMTHVYPRAGVYPTRIDIAYGGQFSFDGGAWITIPDTAVITGAVQNLTVKTAHARLVS